MEEKFFEQYLEVRSSPDDDSPLDAVFLSDAVRIVAHSNDVSEDVVLRAIIERVSVSKNISVEEAEILVDELIEKRVKAHSLAEDWKESLMAERDAIAREHELIF